MQPRDQKPPSDDPERHQHPLTWREIAALVGTYAAGLLFAGLVVILLVSFFL